MKRNKYEKSGTAGGGMVLLFMVVPGILGGFDFGLKMGVVLYGGF